MAKPNQFAEQYRSYSSKLKNLDPKLDDVAVKQLKNGKAQLVRSWQASCITRAQFKAELETMHLADDLAAGKCTPAEKEQRERLIKEFNDMAKERAKAKK